MNNRQPAPPPAMRWRVVGTAALVAIFIQIRDDIDPVSKGFGFLVLVVAVGGGWRVWDQASRRRCWASPVFNYFFLPPYDTFAIGKAEDVVVLFVFLGLVGADRGADRPRRRPRASGGGASRELRLQQDLSRALVEPQPDADRYGGVLRLVVATFRFADGALFEQPGPTWAGWRRWRSSMPSTGLDRDDRGRRRRTVPAERGTAEPRAAGAPRGPSRSSRRRSARSWRRSATSWPCCWNVTGCSAQRSRR